MTTIGIASRGDCQSDSGDVQKVYDECPIIAWATPDSESAR